MLCMSLWLQRTLPQGKLAMKLRSADEGARVPVGFSRIRGRVALGDVFFALLGDDEQVTGARPEKLTAGREPT